MIEPLPKWIMQRYLQYGTNSRIRSLTTKKPSRFSTMTKMLSIVLSELRQAGWLEMNLIPEYARKRIYKLKNHEQAVKEMCNKEGVR